MSAAAATRYPKITETPDEAGRDWTRPLPTGTALRDHFKPDQAVTHLNPRLADWRGAIARCPSGRHKGRWARTDGFGEPVVYIIWTHGNRGDGSEGVPGPGWFGAESVERARPTALVRLETVWFQSRHPLKVEPLPNNTLDLRYTACHSHHLACDCREAQFAEDGSEYRYELAQAREVFNRDLKGHATWAYTSDGERDEFRECKCTGCGIARQLYFRRPYDLIVERREAGEAR